MEPFKKKKHEQWIKQLYRVIGYYLAEKLKNTQITANQITASRIFLIMIASILILSDNYLLHLVAAFIILVFSMLDALDGSLAIMKNECSLLGTWLDPQTDRLGFLLLFLVIAYYLSNINEFYIYLTMYTLVMFYFRGLVPIDIRLKDKFASLRDNKAEKQEDKTKKKKLKKEKKGLMYQIKLQTNPHTHNVALYIAMGLVFNILEYIMIFLAAYITLWYIWENIKVIKNAIKIDKN